jgi:hypothetical protein
MSKYSQAKIVDDIVRQVLNFILRNVKENTQQVGFGVFMPMNIKIIFFWDMMSCSLLGRRQGLGGN